MIERPQPPKQPAMQGQRQELAAMQEEIRQLRQDIAFLRQLLEHARHEFARVKAGG